MIDRKSWKFTGGLDSSANRLYNWLRQGVNRRLVTFLCRQIASADHGTRSDASVRTRVLEAGSGTAFASSLLAKHSTVTQAICMDFDINALIEAKRRDPTLTAVVGDLMRMPFAADSFTLVFNSSTVEHLTDPSAAVQEMRRVCQDKGRVFVGLPHLWGPLIFQRLIRNTALGVWLGTVFSRSSLDRLLRSAGLTPLAHRRYFWRFFIGAVAAKNTSGNAITAGSDASC